MSELRSADSPPRTGPRIPVIRIKGGQAGMFLIFSRRITWLCSHWNGKRSEPCTIPKDDCRGCGLDLPIKWKGYLHVRSCNSDVSGFVELTPFIKEQIERQGGVPESFRGMRIELRRTKGDKGRLNCVLLPRVCDAGELPEEEDPRESLKVLWEIGNGVDLLSVS